MQNLRSKGLRVLAFAETASGHTRCVGLLALQDPPRETAKESIRLARKAGIRTVMITGDNIDTAVAIAKEVGIRGPAVLGSQLPKMTAAQIVKTAVFARVSPAHKLQILEALKSRGEIVAMSGDGVNDAPALKGAHVGVAMGKNGTEVAREAASIVLADDHYATIVAAIAEGRRIYDNIRKFVLFLLRANFDELLFITTAILIGLPLPYLPLHILWINLMTDALPALALGMEKAEPDIMSRPPRPAGEHLLSGEWGRLVIAGAPWLCSVLRFLRVVAQQWCEHRASADDGSHHGDQLRTLHGPLCPEPKAHLADRLVFQSLDTLGYCHSICFTDCPSLLTAGTYLSPGSTQPASVVACDSHCRFWFDILRGNEAAQADADCVIFACRLSLPP